jgi:two-component system, OmpR family, response regulator
MNKPKILIIDDEVNLTKMLKLNIEETDKYEVMTLNDGTKAINIISDFMPDLLLLDVMMPNIQGNEIADQVIQNKDLEHIKIIFLTAIVTKNEVPDSSKTIGGRKFIAKPVKLNELLEAIEEELAKG